MPTKNRRVATYLPPELDDRFKAFIAERNLRGDSPALITILSEFLGVSLSAAHQVDYSTFVTQEQFNELAGKVSELTIAVGGTSSEALLSKLQNQVDRLRNKLEEQRTERREPDTQIGTVPGQMDLLRLAGSNPPSDLPSELPKTEQSSSHYALLRELISKPTDEPQITEDSDSLSNSSSELKQAENTTSTFEPLNGADLSRRFGFGKKAVTNNKNLCKNDPQKFIDWTRKSDPDGVVWQYNPEDKLYHPIRENLE